ncbi:CheR family methyltransferase [Aquipuribacter nitratireducens]|uniref:protein-glutamate O-methyltransferase n=1 Tax=Aquipuribacter nitratireducens TaxID=650104 RepID=A0ABW0GM57_9MICO
MGDGDAGQETEGTRPDGSDEPAVAPEDGAALDALLVHIREARGFDFTGYKRASLERRLQRRMSVVGSTSYEDYLDRLLLDRDEFTALFDTLLINVTSFFRDTEAWQYLTESVVPDLLARKPTGPLRFWSAGCATGQEPYSLAMVLADHLGVEELRDRVKIYATDVDEDALAQARAASYHERELAGLPASAARYLEPGTRRGLRSLLPDVRRSVIFGRNDLVQDAPISHVDLLLCRNTLMYLTAQTQDVVLRRLHFALEPHGVLFLGKAEMLLSHGSLFAPLEIKRRFFRKVDDGQRVRTAPPGPAAADAASYAPLQRDLVTEAMLASPTAQVVLDREGRLVVTNFRADVLFSLASRDIGQPFADLPLSYRPVELGPVVAQATRERRAVRVPDVDHVRAGGERLRLDVQAVPLLDGDGQLLGVSVVFEDVTTQRQLQTELEHANRQLGLAYEELQSSNEELETTNEELQSTVEELETTNEELQSTNEELETMNEELQSMNDELHVTNQSLQERTEEIEELNGFMGAVLSSLPAGVAVVDGDLRVTAWNERAEDLWGVRRHEAVGQHLLALDIGLPLDALRSMVRDRLDPDGGEAHPPGPPARDAGAVTTLDAVNRRGRPVRVQVTVTPLRNAPDQPAGAVVVMDVVG